MRAIFLLACLLLGTCWATKGPKGPKVTIKQGAVVGKTMTSRSGREFSAFQGIPYAAPPVGELRFQSPKAAPKWSGERLAQKEGSECLQKHYLLPEYGGTEDCLYLNIYTPTTKKSLPVMVWVHGGGFMSGSGATDMYGPDFLLDHDIVLVTINYRLGMLGFLNLGIPEFPGNYGLKDQAAALRWVKENIATFGGNPDSVTIFGESAGAASTHYLLLSPLTKGLYHRAILQSGSAFNPWASVIEGERVGLESAKNLGCDQKDVKKLGECLRKVDAKLFTEEGQAMQERERRILQFAPSVEPEGTVDPFLPVDPRELDFPDIPVITGLTTHEGMLKFFLNNPLSIEKEFGENKDFYIMEDIGLEENSAQWQKTWSKIKTFYKSLEGDEMEQFLHLASDVDFTVGVDQLMRRAVASDRKNPVYLYEFTHDGTLALVKNMANIERPGTCHADELGYQFTQGNEASWKKAPARDIKMIDKMATLWTNFAKTGNPTPDDSLGAIWLPVEKTSDNPDELLTRYLDLGENIFMHNESLNGQRMRFWADIYAESKRAKKEEL